MEPYRHVPGSVPGALMALRGELLQRARREYSCAAFAGDEPRGTWSLADASAQQHGVGAENRDAVRIDDLQRRGGEPIERRCGRANIDASGLGSAAQLGGIARSRHHAMQIVQAVAEMIRMTRYAAGLALSFQHHNVGYAAFA